MVLGVGLATSLLVLGSGCDSSSSDSAAAYGDKSGENGATPGLGIDQPSGTGGSLHGVGGAAPEVESTLVLEAPQAGLHYVYAANPDRNNVSVIDAESLTIHTVDTGREPRHLQTLPGQDRALLVNLSSDEVSLLDTKAGVTKATQTPVGAGSNAIAVSPDGLHAVVYFDETRRTPGSTIAQVQEVSVLGLADGGLKVGRVAVNFGPRAVLFGKSPKGSPEAYVVTEEGVSVIDLGAIDKDASGLIRSRTVRLFTGTAGKDADVSVTPDGRWAIGRAAGSSRLRLAALSGAQAPVELDVSTLLGAAPPPMGTGGTVGAGGAAGAGTGGAGGSEPLTGITDLDLAPDGSYALCVVRDRNALVRIPVPGGFTQPSLAQVTKITGGVIGQTVLDPTGHWALGFTTASLTIEQIVRIDLKGTEPPYWLDLRKSVAAVAFSVAGDRALVVHQKRPGDPNAPGIDLETQTDRSNGYTVIDIEAMFAKLTPTTAAPTSTLLVPGQPYAFLMFDAAPWEVHRVSLDTLLVDKVALGSKPISLGVVPSAKRLFVPQEHPDGRITFVNWTTLLTSSVTGYERNSQIRE